MSYRRGSGYFGSNSLKTSAGLDELIQQHKPSYFTIPLNCYKFSFINHNLPCKIKINGSDDEIYIPQGSGFETDLHDMEITQFVVVEAGIIYSYAGAF